MKETKLKWLELSTFNLKNLTLLLAVTFALTVQVVEAPTFNNAIHKLANRKIQHLEKSEIETPEIDQMKRQEGTLETTTKPLWTNNESEF